MSTLLESAALRRARASSEAETRETTLLDGGAAQRLAANAIDSEVVRRWSRERPRPLASRIGRFIVLEELGRGGMGAVYSAYDEQLDRKVAIKVLLEDRDDADARRRFRREGQAMARVSHPNVVTVHEVGGSHDGVFLAMEFIRGQSMSKWLRTEPPWRQVIDAFISAGEGLAAAHEAGLVHRDLKPHNIMRGDDGVVKVLDFGLARASLGLETGESDPVSQGTCVSSESALLPFTRTGTVMGTPAYMSPEQVQGGPIDARSDQFSFCVALYEGLYGERPFDGETLEALLDSMSVERVRPAPRGRKIPPAIRKVLLRGLAYEPDDRWSSMEALLDPLRRVITPHRGRGWVVAVVTAGMLGTVGLGIDRYEARAERCTGAASHLEGTWDDAARQRVREAILGTEVSYAAETWTRVEGAVDDYAASWIDAHTEACEATAVRHEQSEQHRGLRMGCLEKRRQHLQATVGELARADETTVERAVEAISHMPRLSRCADVEALAAEVPPPEDPAVAERVAKLDEQLVEVEARQQAGRYDEALVVLEPVIAEASTLDYEPLMARVWLRAGLLQVDRGDYERAVEVLKKAYGVAMAHTLTSEAARASAVLTNLLGSRLARFPEAHRWAEDAEPLSRAVQHDEARAFYLQSLGLVLLDEGQHREAYDRVREARELLERTLGPDHLLVADAVASFGDVAHTKGEDEVAFESYERARTIWEQTLGPQHPRVAYASHDLGNVAFHRGEYDDAHAHFERAYGILERALGPDHPETARVVNALGAVLEMRGEYDEARAHYRRALVTWEEAFGSEHPDVAGALTNLGVLALTQGRYDRAREPLERALVIFEKVLGSEHPQVAAARSNVGIVAMKDGRLDDARAAYERALVVQREVLGDQHPHVTFNRFNLANVSRRQGRFDEARDLLLRVLEAEQETLGPDHDEIGTTLGALGGLELERGDYEAAQPWLQRALAVKERALGPDNIGLADLLQDLGVVALELGHYERARDRLLRCVTLKDASLKPDNPTYGEVLLTLGRAHLALDEPAEAIVVLERGLSVAALHGVTAAELAKHRFTLARALWVAPVGAGRDRARARSLAEHAREALVDAEAVGWLRRADVEAWLRRHRGS